MDTDAGIWIDHEKAFVVLIRKGKGSLCSIKSGVEGRVRLSGGSRTRQPYGPQEKSSERKRDGRREHELQDYYQSIAKIVQDCRKIIILGPGEVKLGLAKEMKRSKSLASKIIAVEKADKMTENQLKALFLKRYSR